MVGVNNQIVTLHKELILLQSSLTKLQQTNNMHGRLLVTIDHFHLEPEILNSLFFLKIYLFHTLPSLPSMGIHRPVLTSLASQILENPDFQDFWYYELIKNKKFETFPGHARLIQIAFEINLKFSSRGKVIYLLKNLEDSALNCLSESTPDYKKHFKLLLVLLQEFGEEFAAPKLVLSKRSPAIFIDFLRQIIEAILNIEPDFIFSVKGSIDTLRNKVDFLITFTGDTLSLQPSEVRFNLFTSIEAVLKEVGSFLYSFFFVRDPVLAPRMDLELSYLLRKFELIEANIKEHCIAVSNMPSRTTRKTAVVSFFIVDSVLDDLTDLLNHKADKIVGVNDQILTLHDELMFLRSSLTVTDITLQKHAELEELVTQTTNIAYEIEYVINSFSPVWYLTLRLPQFMYENKLIRMGIKKMKNNIDTGIIQVENYPTEQVLSQDKGPLNLEDIVVGFDNKATEIAEQLVRGPEHLQIISIFGMPGVGKTTLAKKLYYDPSVVHHFDKRACLVEALHKSLIKRKYLVVFDDIRDLDAWNDFGRYFPDNKNGSRILFTTQHKEVGLEASHHSVVNELPILSEVECWELLQQKVFHGEHWPQELLNIGKQIAKCCHGLPLAVVVIAAVLEKMDMKEHLWHKVARSLSSGISEDPNNFMNILEHSYKHLPMHLKPCFLYFGAFKEYKEISVKRLISLWVSEGFIKKEERKSSEDVAYEYLMDLINRSLIQVAKRTSLDGVKSCKIHDLLHDMCLRIGKQQNFLKEVQNFKLLRVLDMSGKNFKSNDLTGIEWLVHLRYLAVPCILRSIERLHKLEFLYVDNREEVEIPDFLLDMVNLRYLLFRSHARFSKSSSQRATKDESFQENNLQSISSLFISNKMDEKILRCSPNLRKLKCFLTEVQDLGFLNRLESLKLSVHRDYVRHLIRLPLNLKKLTVSGFYMSREQMNIIGRLPNLVVLKLREGSFHRRQWNTTEGEFQQLKFLELFSVQNTEWNASSDHFPRLQRLVLRHCKSLEKIPSSFCDILTLLIIETLQIAVRDIILSLFSFDRSLAHYENLFGCVKLKRDIKRLATLFLSRFHS
ncbi:putative late blight resistance protein-like protein R1A-3 [Forsythia ovata]|uniref:Late blight resistance protein-like protein R1A-3 n=1 Tax=Forsythia ovata TaxID=205694 RepID=A0ABD1TUP3_9LAMI